MQENEPRTNIGFDDVFNARPHEARFETEDGLRASCSVYPRVLHPGAHRPELVHGKLPVRRHSHPPECRPGLAPPSWGRETMSQRYSTPNAETCKASLTILTTVIQ